MRGPRNLHLLGLVVAGLLLLGAAPATGTGGPDGADADRSGWRADCRGEAGAQVCTVTARPRIMDATGRRRTMIVSLRVDESCTSFHAAVPGALDAARPALLQVDGNPAHPFFAPAELTALADALDAGAAPARPLEPTLAAVWQAYSDGGDGAAAIAALVNNLARVKEPKRLGIGCESTRTLLPELTGGAVLRLSFHSAADGREPYHWPALARREAVVELRGLAEILRSLPVGREAEETDGLPTGRRALPTRHLRH